jgi:hypothetical protein
VKPTDYDDHSAGFDLEQSISPLYFLCKGVSPIPPKAPVR